MSERGAMICVLATELSEAIRTDERGEGHDIGAGLFGTAVSAWIRKTVDAFIETAKPKDDGCAPIVKIVVGDADSIRASFYAPGLPPGEYDLYLRLLDPSTT